MALAPIPALVVLALLYVHGYVRVRRERVGWPLIRVCCFLGGLATIAAAVLPPLGTHDEEFSVHVAQHLLLAMAAPLLLAVSAPLTLLLRILSPPTRRSIVRFLHARPVRLLAHPVPAALLDVVPLYLLYLTPLYGYTLAHPAAHELLHAHFLLAGCIFAWAIVGIDPLPGRASMPVRSAVIVVAFAAHGTLAKLMYARGPHLAAAEAVSASAWRVGAQLMWYGGDAIELLLVTVFALRWYRLEGRRLERARGLAPAGQLPR